MFLPQLVCLALSVVVGADRPSVPAADSTAATTDTTLVPLTVDALSHMQTFYTSILKEPDSVRIKRPLSVSLHGVGHAGPEQVNLPHVLDIQRSAQFSVVAADLQRADLTAQQFEQYRRSLYTARLTEQLTWSASPQSAWTHPSHPSVAWKNVEFLRAHQQEFDALMAAVMIFPPVRYVVLGQPAPQIATHQWLNAPNSTYHTTFGDGHVYIVFFTASWCGACQYIYPVLDNVLKKFAPQGVRAVYADASMGLQEDGSVLSGEKALNWLKQVYARHDVTSPIAIFHDVSSISESGYFDDIHLPLVAIIDGAGKVQDQEGWFDGLEPRLSDVVTQLTAQQHWSK